MAIDFTNFERPENIPAEILGDSKLLAYINGAIDKEKSAAVSLIESKRDAAVTAKALADEKVEELREKLEKAVKDSPNDSEETKKLRAQLASAKEDASVEYTAKIDALSNKLSEQEQTTKSLQSDLDRSEVTGFLNGEIAKYNAKHPTVRIVDGAESYLIDAGLKAFKKTENGQIRAFDGDEALTGTEGFMTGVEFISSLREQPHTSLFFKQPTGGGATGGNGGGAGDKTMTRSKFEGLPPQEQAQVVTTHKITDG